MNSPIYLDNNATTKMDPRVAEAVWRAYRDLPGNPASPHRAGQEARRMLEAARDEVAGILGARVDGRQTDRVIFTSGGTESNNLAIAGLAGTTPGQILVSSIEHPSVLETARSLSRHGHQMMPLPVTAAGRINTAAFRELLSSSTRLVSVMLVNHETGVRQPVDELAEVCRATGTPLHTDAVQAVGKLSIDFCRLGVAAMSLSAHKFHGPVGVGALVLRHDVSLQPLHFGGFQQLGLRPGTEAVPLAVGMAHALALWQTDAGRRERIMRQRRDQLESALLQAEPDLRIHGSQASRAPHTSNVSFPGADRQALVMALDLAGVACATGSACASGSSEPSPVLRAMGLADTQIRSAIRFSVSHLTTASEIDQAAHRILLVYRSLRQASATRKRHRTPRTALPESI